MLAEDSYYELVGDMLSNSAVFLVVKFLYRVLVAFMYVGLLTIPFLLILPPTVARPHFTTKYPAVLLTAVIVVSFGLSIVLLHFDRSMPLSSNILFATTYDLDGSRYITGVLGPRLLKDTSPAFNGAVVALPAGVLFVLTLVSLLSASFIGVALLAGVGRLLVPPVFRRQVAGGAEKPLTAEQWRFAFVLLVFFAYFLPLSVTPGFLDRYLLPFIPLVMAGMLILSRTEGAAMPRQRVALGSVAGAIMLLYTVGATHDYLSWNRARWAGLNYLMTDVGVSPAEIDGGFEFNGWYGYSPGYQPRKGTSWWWVEDDKFVVSFGKIDGYEVIQRFAYQNFIPPRASQKSGYAT